MHIISRNHKRMARFRLWIREYLSRQMAALYNRHSSYSAHPAISAAALPAPLAFVRSRYGRALLLSLNTHTKKPTVLAPDICSRLRLLGFHDLRQPCWVRKRKKRPRRHRGMTEDAVFFFFFFFFRGSVRNQQVDYSVTFGRSALHKNKNKTNKQTTTTTTTTTKPYAASLEALDAKVSMVVASTVLWGRLSKRSNR